MPVAERCQASADEPVRWHYLVYGLRLSSNLALPGLEPLQTNAREPQIRVTLGKLPGASKTRWSEPAQSYYRSPELGRDGEPYLKVDRLRGESCYRFVYDEGVEFVVDGSQGLVWGVWGQDLFVEDAVLYLLGPILGFMLRLRGVTCLHSGAVVVAGRALALAGPSGAGKSTLTTILARQGWPVMTDDVLPLDLQDNLIQARSGYPRLRLRPDVVESLYGHADAKPRLTPGWERRFLDLHPEGLRFHSGPVSLGALYLLERNDDEARNLSIAPVTGHEALSLLVANTYRNELLSRGMRGEEFRFLAELVNRVPVRRLSMRRGLTDLELTASRVVEDFEEQIHVRA